MVKAWTKILKPVKQKLFKIKFHILKLLDRVTQALRASKMRASSPFNK